MRRSSSAANRRRIAGRITSPMSPEPPPIASKGYQTCRGWALNAAATPTSAKHAPTVIIPTNRPITSLRARPRPPSTPMSAPTTPTRPPILAPSSRPDRALHPPPCAASAWAVPRWRCIGPSQTAPRPGNTRLISKRLGACDAPLMSKGSSNRRQLDSPCSAASGPCAASVRLENRWPSGNTVHISRQPVRVRGTEPQIERTGFRRCVDQLDLLDQPIQPQAHRGVRDPVLGGEVLQRPPGQQESLQEANILLAQVLNPRLSHVPTPFSIFTSISILLI